MIVLIFMALLAGCNIDDAIDPQGGIWDRYFVYPLAWALDYFAALLNPGGEHDTDKYGWSIVIVTIIIRFFTLPLMVKQLKTSKMMQVLQPEMKELREKYKKDQQKMQQKTMELFQKNNVNPLAGCLPIMVQMPILIAFYHAIYRHSEIRDYSFLWFELGATDPYYILPILAGITTYIQQKMMGMQANPQMKMLMVILPVMITIFGFYFPTALILYWVVGNLFTIAQTYFMRDMYKAKQEDAKK